MAGERLQGAEEAEHVVVGQAVEDVRPLPPGLNEPGLAEDLEVRARALHWGRGLLRERLDGLLALGEQVE